MDVKTYFVFAKQSQRIKIGKSQNPDSRIKSLQTASPEKLDLVGILPHDVEADLHQQFKGSREHGEWFRLSDELRLYICRTFPECELIPPVPRDNAELGWLASIRAQKPEWGIEYYAWGEEHYEREDYGSTTRLMGKIHESIAFEPSEKHCEDEDYGCECHACTYSRALNSFAYLAPDGGVIFPDIDMVAVAYREPTDEHVLSLHAPLMHLFHDMDVFGMSLNVFILKNGDWMGGLAPFIDNYSWIRGLTPLGIYAPKIGQPLEDVRI